MELNLANLQAIFEYDQMTGRYSGYLIRAEFRGQAISARQGMIWANLRDRFAEEATAFTPEEWEEMQTDLVAAT